jgi:hypothetical protein
MKPIVRNLELLKLSFTFVFQFRSTRVFVGKGNELPGPVFQRTFQNVGVFVASEHTKITRLLAVPPVYTGLYLYGPGAQRKARRTFVALCVGLRFDFDLHDGTVCQNKRTT